MGGWFLEILIINKFENRWNKGLKGYVVVGGEGKEYIKRNRDVERVLEL